MTTTDKRKQSPSSEELTEYKEVNLPLTSMTSNFALKKVKGQTKIVGQNT